MRGHNAAGHHTKQQLGKTIMMYHPQPAQHPMTGFHSKPRSPNPTNPRSNNNQAHNYGTAQYSSHVNVKQSRVINDEIEKMYFKLQTNLSIEKKNFKKAVNGLQKMVVEYYKELKRLLNQDQQYVLESIEDLYQQMEIKFSDKQNSIQNKIREVYNKENLYAKNHSKNSMHIEALKVQFNKAARLDVPVFKIEFNACYKIFETMIKQYRPVILDSQMSNSQYLQNPIPCCLQQKQNISINQSQLMHKKSRGSHLSPSPGSPSSASCDMLSSQPSSTIKKSSHAPAAPISHNNNPFINSVCEFSCQQQLRWNPNDVNNNKFDYDKVQQKKDMATEVIMEQPSSCEDSVLLSDSKEVY